MSNIIYFTLNDIDRLFTVMTNGAKHIHTLRRFMRSENVKYFLHFWVLQIYCISYSFGLYFICKYIFVSLKQQLSNIVVIKNF